ncbi:ABC transporter permease [Viridibacillus arvi]|uniref:ABC transporter permease n=1 Tax=Viridibacillus arvi TaxID=263475 RepID=UPI0034CF6B3B
MTLLRVMLSSFKTQLKQSFARETFRFVILFQPIFYSCLLYFMFSQSQIENVGEYVVISTGIMNLWSAIIFSTAGDLERERFMGTLEPLFASPSDFKFIFLGKVFANLLLGLFSLIVSFVVTRFIFDIPVVITNPLQFGIAFVLTCISFMVISLIVALLFALSRNARLMMNSMEYPIYILCGIVFPITYLPSFLQYISYGLSPTWAVELLRMAMIGGSHLEFIHGMTILFVLTVIYFLISMVLFKKIDHITRVKGTLGVH